MQRVRRIVTLFSVTHTKCDALHCLVFATTQNVRSETSETHSGPCTKHAVRQTHNNLEPAHSDNRTSLPAAADMNAGRETHAPVQQGSVSANRRETLSSQLYCDYGVMAPKASRASPSNPELREVLSSIRTWLHCVRLRVEHIGVSFLDGVAHNGLGQPKFRPQAEALVAFARQLCHLIATLQEQTRSISTMPQLACLVDKFGFPLQSMCSQLHAMAQSVVSSWSTECVSSLTSQCQLHACLKDHAKSSNVSRSTSSASSRSPFLCRSESLGRPAPSGGYPSSLHVSPPGIDTRSTLSGEPRSPGSLTPDTCAAPVCDIAASPLWLPPALMTPPQTGCEPPSPMDHRTRQILPGVLFRCLVFAGVAPEEVLLLLEVAAMHSTLSWFVHGEPMEMAHVSLAPTAAWWHETRCSTDVWHHCRNAERDLLEWVDAASTCNLGKPLECLARMQHEVEEFGKGVVRTRSLPWNNHKSAFNNICDAWSKPTPDLRTVSIFAWALSHSLSHSRRSGAHRCVSPLTYSSLFRRKTALSKPKQQGIVQTCLQVIMRSLGGAPAVHRALEASLSDDDRQAIAELDALLGRMGDHIFYEAAAAFSEHMTTCKQHRLDDLGLKRLRTTLEESVWPLLVTFPFEGPYENMQTLGRVQRKLCEVLADHLQRCRTSGEKATKTIAIPAETMEHLRDLITSRLLHNQHLGWHRTYACGRGGGRVRGGTGDETKESDVVARGVLFHAVLMCEFAVDQASLSEKRVVRSKSTSSEWHDADETFGCGSWFLFTLRFLEHVKAKAKLALASAPDSACTTTAKWLSTV